MNLLRLIILALTGSVIQIVNAGQTSQILNHDGLSRSYLLYTPSSYQLDKSVPLLIALHGRGGYAQRMADLTGFNTRADRHGFVVVYPEGIDKQWNYVHGISGYKKDPSDSDFLLKVVDEVKNKYNIDHNRVYVTGISNGGFMAQRLACYAPKQFAAFASVAAGGYAAMPLECDNNGPVNMLYIHGTADEKVPWKGLGIVDADGNQQLVTMSIADSVKFWANRNQCSPNVDTSEIPVKGDSPGTRVKVLSSSDCVDDAEVALYAIFGGGHNWPGVLNMIPPEVAGRVNMDIHASDVIWSFFDNKKSGQ